MTLPGVIAGAALAALVYLFIVQPLRDHRLRERRDWPSRVRLDYETERVRDHFFDALSAADIHDLMGLGWEPPPEVVDRWQAAARYRAVSRMTPAELDAYLKLHAAGIHLPAHPDDLRFEA